jgi:hypothetical protein
MAQSSTTAGICNRNHFIRKIDTLRPPGGRENTSAGVLKMSVPIPTDADLSPAIVSHVGLMFSVEEQAQVRALVGDEGLARIKEIDAFAGRAEFWAQQDSDKGYVRMKEELAARYPTLSPSARERLATRAAWNWR